MSAHVLTKRTHRTWKNIDNIKTNKLDLPKVYRSWELAISIISCFCKQTNWPSNPNQVRIWHRLPRQMPIRCYLIEGQSQTNKSNRKYLTISAHGKNSISGLVTKLRRLEKPKDRTYDQTSYVLIRRRWQHRQKKTGERIICCVIPVYPEKNWLD